MDNKDLQKMVSKFNKRVERMYNYSDGSLESLDTLRQQLYMLTGKESEVPKVSIKGMGADDRVKLVGIMNAYFDNPESRVRSYNAMRTKSIATYANNRGFTSNQIVAFNTLVKSPEFAKLKELLYKDSRDRMTSVDDLFNSGLNGKQAIDLISEWVKRGQLLTFRQWVDGVTQGISKGMDYNTSNKMVSDWSVGKQNIGLNTWIDYIYHGIKNGDTLKQCESNIVKWQDYNVKKKDREKISFKGWYDAIHNKK